MICRLNTDRVDIKSNRVVSINNGWSEDDIDTEESYEVFGIGIYQGKMKLLLDMADRCRPFWYDVSDFLVIDSTVPSDWESASFDESDWSIIIGYKALVRSETHFDGLLEREEKDIDLFYRRKQAQKALREAASQDVH